MTARNSEHTMWGMDVEKRFVTLGGECFEAEFQCVQHFRLTENDYRFRLYDVRSGRGERLVSVCEPLDLQSGLLTHPSRVEFEINVIRRAFDSGMLSFDHFHDCQTYQPLIMSEEDVKQQPVRSDEELRLFIIWKAYWLSYRHPSKPGHYSVNFATPVDLDYLGATQADIRRNVFRLHKQGMLEFGKPTEKLIVEYESTMPRKQTTPPPKAADWPPEKVHRALKDQLSTLEQELVGKSHDAASSDERAWSNLTENILVHGFGEGSSNVTQFKQAKLVGQMWHPGMSEAEEQQQFDRRLEALAKVVNGNLKELELMGVALQSKQSPTFEPRTPVTFHDLPAKQPATHQGLLVFISHSSKDADLALALIDLLKAGLGLLANQIRCSSVDGYRLPIGINTEDKLREEVNAAKVVVGLITPSSLASYYVMFELGARWGAKLFLAPLLAGVQASDLRQPLSLLNALSANNDAQLHQLLEDISKQLGVPLQSTASYVRYIALVKSLVDSIPNGAMPQSDKAEQDRSSETLHDEFAQDLMQHVRQVVGQTMTRSGQLLLRWLLFQERIDVLQRFMPEISIETQHKQMDVAVNAGIVRREREQGGLMNTFYVVNPEMKPALRKVLPELLRDQ
jgi:hypothetical protein